MPWHAKERLRHRLATTSPEPLPMPPQMAGDFNEIIGLLNQMLNDHYAYTHRRSTR